MAPGHVHAHGPEQEREGQCGRFCCYEKHERKTKRRLFCGANCTNEQAEYSGATIDAGVNILPRSNVASRREEGSPYY